MRDNNCGYYIEIYKHDKCNRYKNANPCYALNVGNIGNADYFVWIYVDANGFGIDFDHTFGGNAFYKFKPFDSYNTFADGYNAVMNYIRKHIK